MEQTKTTVQLAQELGRLESRHEKLTSEVEEVSTQINEVKQQLLDRLVGE